MMMDFPHEWSDIWWNLLQEAIIIFTVVISLIILIVGLCNSSTSLHRYLETAIFDEMSLSSAVVTLIGVALAIAISTPCSSVRVHLPLKLSRPQPLQRNVPWLEELPPKLVKYSCGLVELFDWLPWLWMFFCLSISAFISLITSLKFIDVTLYTITIRL